MEKPKVQIGPFRATKLWNTIISDFRSGIVLKRHRWRMRHHDNCFTSTEATDWLHDYLCNSENFGPWVTRSQVVTLLDKFVQSKIIEEVRTSKAASSTALDKIATFEDNGHLYRFLPVSPMKKLRSALASRSSIQSLSPSPKATKTKSRTSGQLGPSSLAARPQPLSSRDPNIEPAGTGAHQSAAQENVYTQSAQENVYTRRDGLRPHVSRSLSLKDTKGLKPYSSRPLASRDANAAPDTHTHTSQDRGQSSGQSRPLALRDSNVNTVHNDNNFAVPNDRLTDKDPQPSARPLAMRNGNTDAPQPHAMAGQSGKDMPRCTLVARPLTVEQIEEVWKSATLKRLQRLLWLSTLDGLLDESVVVPSDIIHNCTHINKNGVVQLLSKEKDLPHWVISAMRCLANWPNKVDSELPSYPGFERDVFKTISNYFQNLPEPLITYNRYDLVVEAFVSMECRDRGIVPGQEVVIVREGGLTSFQSVESLMTNMTMGGRTSSTNTPNMDRRNPYTRDQVADRKVRRSTSFGQVIGMPRQSDTPLIPNGGVRLSQRTLNRQFGSMDTIALRKAGGPHTDSGHIPNGGAGGVPQNTLNRQFVSMDTVAERKFLQADRRNMHGARAGRSNPHRVSNAVDDYGFANMEPIPKSKNPDIELSSLSDQSHYANLQPVNTLQRKCSSLTNIQNVGAKTTHQPTRTRNGGLFASKRFGSATELFNRLVKKKSPSQAALSGSEETPEQTEGKPQRYHVEQKDKAIQKLDAIISPGLAPQPSYPVYNLSPVDGAAPPPPSKNMVEASSQTDNTTPISDQPYNRISPPYPAPIRATLSFSEISQQRSFKSSPSHDNNNSAFTPTGLPSAILGPSQGLHSPRSTPNIQTSTPFYQNLGQTANARLKRQDSMLSISSLYLGEDKSYCQEALRLCLLLLPPAQRRALHLLLRLMSKMENNTQLALCTDMSTRQLLLHTFSRCILRCEEEVDLDESLAIRIVEYFLDNHTTLFTTPQELRDDIEERLTYLKRSQIKYEPDSENMQPAGFCAQMSVEDYEKQKMISSQQAIVDLLDNIISDKTMPSKDKKKKLKLFQKAYPDIYHRRLPSSSSEAELFPAKPKIKQPMLNVKKSLLKLKPIR